MHLEPESLTRQLKDVLRRAFGHAEFRPHQREVCESIAAGESCLLVMPTGAGKSLCYQLPGLCRPGPTLVLSPLIALMDDQVGSLRALGLRADSIHSGKTRIYSREVCLRYLSGELDFLFIAPERLSVPGFAEFLGKRTPGLVAIDEAHCISEWGHDFRPDYRLLRQHLHPLMPAPVVALTATATPLVQQDIVEQLGVREIRRFVHGFRRDNLAIEACELPQSERRAFIRRLLGHSENRPAIVYAPTRKESESVAAACEPLKVRAYHAGLDPQARAQIQRQFADGSLEVVVATIAFGMGIDKADVRTVVHCALPPSVENYYQEIGRAGRDGKPSRAVLLHSSSDQRTLTWFIERDYPDAARLEAIFRQLGNSSISFDELQGQTQLTASELRECLDKLVAHGACRVVQKTRFVALDADWKTQFERQRARRLSQLRAMTSYTNSPRCRMLGLVDYFGDALDSGQPCGLCDICRPAESLSPPLGPPSPTQRAHLLEILTALRDRDGQATGQLHREHEPRCKRPEFQDYLQVLRRANWIELVDDEFEKEGRSIAFQRVFLTAQGHRAGLSELKELKLWKRLRL